MKVLVLNCGSSSIKHKVFDATSLRMVAKGSVDRIGGAESEVVLEACGGKRTLRCPVASHGKALEVIIDMLLSADEGVVADLGGLCAVGHRVVHGGSAFRGPARLTPEVIARIQECVPLAPLHNPPALEGIRGAMRILPDVPQVAVFDTAFHADIPAVAHTYALPYSYYNDHGVKRYGFHGLSYDYVLRRVRALRRGRRWPRVVIAHLGNGASMAAIHRGRSVDTSMGMTPMEGLVMGSRCGDLDPGVIIFLQQHLGLTVDEVENMLNRESGLLGLSGVSNDVRDVLRRARKGDRRSRLALDVFAYRVKKYIGAFAAGLGGLDVLAFTGGVGENAPEVRAAVCDGLEFLGIDIDPGLNEACGGGEREISRSGSTAHVLIVPTDEERLIAEETVALVEPGTIEAAV